MDTETANQLACDAISHAADQAKYAIQVAVASYGLPSVIYRPHLTRDGNMYCALYGENLHEGCAGFGSSPEKAMVDFNKNWYKEINYVE